MEDREMNIGCLEIKISITTRKSNVKRWVKEHIPNKWDGEPADPISHKINAIKKYRNTYDTTLKDAKEAVDKIIGW